MVNFTTGNYRPCIDIECVLSSLICFTITCTSVGTVNKIAASSYTFYFQVFGKSFLFRNVVAKALVPLSYCASTNN